MGRNGTGVIAASETSIEITFTYRGKRCRERLKLAPTPANMKRAAQHRAAILDAIQKQTFEYRVTFPDSPRAVQFAERKGEILTVERYLDSWLDIQKAHLKASTYDGYRKVVNNHLIPAFQGMKLSDLSRKAIKEWCASQKISLKALKNRLSVLRSALNLAAQDELIDVNPLYGWQWKSRAVLKNEDDIDPFSASEQQQILSSMNGQDRNFFKFAFWTGLRTSELIAVEWSDIDWDRNVIQIRRSLTRAAIATKTCAEPPKTRAGKRDVKLLAPALEALEAQKLHTLGKTNYIFTNPRTGKRWSGDLVVRGAWKRALDAAKIRYRRPYQTRHTYASMMLTAGESPMWVAQQMGHNDWTMIARIYGRWIKDAVPEAGSKAVKMFS